MTNDSRIARRGGKWLLAVPAVALVAAASAACTNSEEPAPADATYSTPAVWTGGSEPTQGNADEHGKEGQVPPSQSVSDTARASEDAGTTTTEPDADEPQATSAPSAAEMPEEAPEMTAEAPE